MSPDFYTPTLPPSSSNVSVQIEGYDEVRSGDGCYFYAHANGGSGNYSYAWSIGATEVEEDSDYLFYQNTGSSFTVSVRVFDGTTSAESTFEVTVSPSAGECYIY